MYSRVQYAKRTYGRPDAWSGTRFVQAVPTAVWCAVPVRTASHASIRQAVGNVQDGAGPACRKETPTCMPGACNCIANYNRPCVVTGGHAQARRTTTRPVSRTTPYARWSAGAVSLPPLHTTRWTGRVLARWSAVSQCQRLPAAPECGCIHSYDVPSLSFLLAVRVGKSIAGFCACLSPTMIDYHYTCSAVRTKLDDQELAASQCAVQGTAHQQLCHQYLSKRIDGIKTSIFAENLYLHTHTHTKTNKCPFPDPDTLDCFHP